MQRAVVVAILFLAGWAALFTAGPARAEVMDRIVATVNGEILTLKEVNDRLNPVVKLSKITNSAEIETMRRKVLDSLVDQKIIFQAGAKANIIVSDQDVDEAINHIKQSNNVTQAQFEAKILENGGSVAAFRADLKADIIRSKLIDKEVRARVVITSEEIDAFLRSHGIGPKEVTQTSSSPEPSSQASAAGSPGQIRIRNIVFTLPAEATEAIVRTRLAEAEKVRNEIQGGLDFVKAAAMHSDAANAREGGDLGRMSWDDMDPRVKSGLAGLKPGQVSRPVMTAQGIQLFQIVDMEKAWAPQVQETKVEKSTGQQIGTAEERQRARQILGETRLKEKFEEWVRNLRSRAIVRITL